MNFDTLAETILESLPTNKGITISPKGACPIRGYMVAEAAHEKIIDTNKVELSKLLQSIKDYIQGHLHIAFLPEKYFGFWLDDDGLLYMDISTNIQEKYMAHNIGHLNNQKSIFHLDTKEVIWLQTK